MSNPIAELLNAPIPEKLWHYTSIQGFRDIVLSKAMWATDVRFLNDREEFMHAGRIAREILEKTSELDTLGFVNRDFVAKAVELGFESGPMAHAQFFVACFSASEDQLGQWRGYSHGTSSVSLAFALRNARPPGDSGSLVVFAPCVYDSADKEDLLLDALHHVRDEISGYRERIFKRACQRDPTKCGAANKESVVSEYLKANPTEQEPEEHFSNAALKTRADCFKLAGLLKNSSFKEEKEWRLVLPTLPEHSAPMKNPPQFRVAKNALVPYVPHPLDPHAGSELYAA
jgi:Protein of unknown function (DUF2971)